MATLEERSEEGSFGYGRGGLPGEIDLFLRRDGAVEDTAMEIISRWLKWAELHSVRGGRRPAENQLTELSTLAAILVRYHVRNQTAPTPLIAFAIEHVLGLINPRTDNPIPAPAVLKRFGLPVVDKVTEFLWAARLDGEADAVGRTLSERKLASQVEVSRDTIKRWRDLAPYRRRRAFVATLTPVAERIYGKPTGGGR